MSVPIKVNNPTKIAKKLDAMEFHDLGRFGDGSSGVFWGEASDWSPWEMHPECDELLHVLEGAIKLEILPEMGEDITVLELRTGDFVTVPKGLWHRQKLLAQTKEYYLTPGPTLHSHHLDPRKA
ncbi:cupin domain-containing protein [Marinicella meishanensis]|uniref:cupin domain-containing protein n=1 Tax=Marinicella meishanensis TaxID=2873263 RepID=UPI001CBED96A|nr:cupin domain-containing protein [Marinicella sp. NBU2979]